MQLLRHEHSFDEPLGLLGDCHRRIERFLTILHKVVTDAPEDSLPKLYREGLASALQYFDEAAPKHTADEEESLFPRISNDERAAETIAKLEKDHREAELSHDIVDKLGRKWLEDDRIDPESRSEFRRRIEILQKIYAGHIKTEDEELFPLAATLLDEDSLQIIGKEMAARRGLA